MAHIWGLEGTSMVNTVEGNDLYSKSGPTLVQRSHITWANLMINMRAGQGEKGSHLSGGGIVGRPPRQ